MSGRSSSSRPKSSAIRKIIDKAQKQYHERKQRNKDALEQKRKNNLKRLVRIKVKDAEINRLARGRYMENNNSSSYSKARRNNKIDYSVNSNFEMSNSRSRSPGSLSNIAKMQ